MICCTPHCIQACSRFKVNVLINWRTLETTPLKMQNGSYFDTINLVCMLCVHELRRFSHITCIITARFMEVCPYPGTLGPKAKTLKQFWGRSLQF